MEKGTEIFMEHKIFVIYEVLDGAQDILMDIVLKAETDFINSINNNLLLVLFLWLGVSGLTALVIWGREVGTYLKELN